MTTSAKTPQRTPDTQLSAGSPCLRTIRTLLFATTALCAAAGPAAADADLEARVQALEGKLNRILDHLEGRSAQTAGSTAAAQPAGALSSDDAEALRDTADFIASARTPEPVLVELDTPGGVSAQAPLKPAPKPSNKISVRNGDTEFTFKGYVKLDASVSDFSGGSLPTSNLGRDFYIPSLVPVGGEGDGPVFDFNPRETRFIFAVDTDRGGHDIGALIELDFQVTSDGNERVSNSFTPRIRQGYITIDNWLLGQAWSTFQDVGALPDNLDFIGPTEGTVFIRQPMIRYTKGPWQIAIEQPETEITGPAGERILPGDDFAPDFVLRYNYKRDWGHVTFAALARALHVDEGAAPGATDDTTFGFGLSASGKVKVGARDDIRFMATYGDGIGRYVGVNIVNDAAIDADGDLEKFETISGFLSYRHFWTPTLRSNLTGGYFHANNPTLLVGTGVTEEVYSIHANLIATVIPKLDVGVEYIYANRRLDSGMDGDLNRVQFSTKYSF